MARVSPFQRVQRHDIMRRSRRNYPILVSVPWLMRLVHAPLIQLLDRAQVWDGANWSTVPLSIVAALKYLVPSVPDAGLA
jgi:hypothetical protein